ncbi:hypothetical protein AAFF_G00346630 [Aldrovandia affinis]|uniref:Immunoglobulin domain-containing protein n=1 Tax=Aldrovandia affinis TaxID=143900 RepID=A0AAD7SK26_9TELE|nr:hypothetical protein AAFF_G00346630 [Aldrovandia affinis]
MGIGIKRAVPFCVTLCLLLALLQGLEIPDPQGVEYIRAEARGLAGGSVTLGCGSTLPSIYIWGYTGPATHRNQAVVYNYGHGPKVQRLSSSLGQLRVVPNTSSLVIDKLLLSAAGMYTCQALYDTADGPKLAFYFIQLDVLEEGEPGSAHV